MGEQPTKIEKSLSEEQFREFCARLSALPGDRRTLRGIQEFAQSEYGITCSHEAAKSFKQGPYKRYLERYEAGRDTRERLMQAVGAGASTLDAIEEAMVLELEDHLTSGEIDLKFITATLLKLRTSISLREDSRRKQGKLEADLKLRDEQIAKLERERAKAEAKDQAARAILDDASLPLEQRVGKMRNLFSIGG